MGRRATGRGDGERGAALILTLLVLAIMVVLVVQFAYSIKVEENVVQNSQDDSALELAARGAPYWIAALLRDDTANGAPSGPVDTLADILFDPNIPEARELTVGKVTLTIEAEDLDRRLPLLWLADPRRKEFTQRALQYLIEHLQARGGSPEAGDPETLAQAITERVEAIAGTGDGAASGEENSFPATRALLSIEELLAEEAGSEGGASGPAAAGGVSRALLFGDPQADPPQPGLASFVTTWPVPAINLNTALPEVLWALIPEEDKAKNPNKLREGELPDELVAAIRGVRIDPAFVAAEAGGDAAPAGDQGASRQWSGKAFTEVKELESSEIHEKLEHIFGNEGAGQDGPGGPGGPSGPGGPGGPGQPGGEPDPDSGGGGAGEGDEDGFELKDALDVRSRFYAVRVSAQLSPEVAAVYRLVLHRNDQDVVSVLLFEEAGT